MKAIDEMEMELFLDKERERIRKNNNRVKRIKKKLQYMKDNIEFIEKVESFIDDEILKILN